MTNYRVLYYPDFVPDATWLRQVLLVCDGVLRIVPEDVELNDPDELKRLQDRLKGGLDRISPEADDAAVEYEDRARLARAFRVLGERRSGSADDIVLTISDSRLAIDGHVFVHDAKLSDFVVQELKRNGLLNESLRELAPERFHVIDRNASDLILTGLASRIARRVGLDAITDKPMPFAYAALNGVPRRAPDVGAAEGALLSSLATLLIPADVRQIELSKYCEIRDSYAGIRQAFQQLTAELATIHRLSRIHDPERLVARIEGAARDFDREFQEYRNSQYARTFREWTPLCVGGALSVAGGLVDPLLGVGLATASVAIQAIEKCMQRSPVQHERIFNMLSGVQKDVVAASGIRELV